MRWPRLQESHPSRQTIATPVSRTRWAAGLCAATLGVVAAGVGLTSVQAQVATPTAVSTQAPKGAVPLATAPNASEAKPVWAALTGAQQQALGPLKGEWSQLDAARKQKWLELAARMPSLSAPERERIQQRMTEWVRMSPTERGRARIHFQTAQQIAPGDRKDRWEAYQALPADQRQALAAQASAKRAAPADGAAAPAGRSTTTAAAPSPGRANDAAAAGTKRNVVQPHTTPPANTVPRQVAPTVVQARSGATTSLVTTPAAPPAHHQVGLPKVNAKAGFVDPNTLLPKRGPQGAAVAAVPAASGATPTP